MQPAVSGMDAIDRTDEEDICIDIRTSQQQLDFGPKDYYHASI
jgi:hypothetical protein